MMLEEWHNRMFMGAFHESADSMHWEGCAPMKEHLVRMKAEAQRMRQEKQVKQTSKEPTISTGGIGLSISQTTAVVATIIAVATILVAVRAERKVKKTT